MSEDREHRIRKRAHAIWESQGRPHGSDREHWDQATKEIDAAEGAVNGVAAKTPAKPKAAKPAAAPKVAKAAKAPAAKKPAKKAAPAS